MLFLEIKSIFKKNNEIKYDNYLAMKEFRCFKKNSGHQLMEFNLSISMCNFMCNLNVFCETFQCMHP